jgi:hypothetical protein
MLEALGKPLMKTLPRIACPLAAFALVCLLRVSVSAQDNYEIQVYGSDTVAPGMTMVELHSNLTIKGSRQTSDGTLPTHHAWHETLEVTHDPQHRPPDREDDHWPAL